MKYYSLKKILKKDCVYNIVFGERSNGKTFATLSYALQQYFNHGKQFVYIRRWSEDIKPKRMSNLFNSHLDMITELSGGKFTGIYYRVGVFYLCTYDEHGKAIYNDNDILGYAFSLSETEHNKANSYPNVTTIIFDEFLTNKVYLNDEFILFMNTISTIVRQRTTVKIFMLGNTVNRYSPYFTEMGITNVDRQEQGTIDVYKYGNGELKVALEYTKSTGKSKENNFYFAFDNPRLQMITTGSWELDLYPHLPVKYTPKNVIFEFFIIFSRKIYQCEVIEKGDDIFCYIHDKTTPIKYDDDLVYSLEYSSKLNYNRNIYRPRTDLESKIKNFFIHDKVFYQDNNVGDSINNYLKQCQQM